MTQDLFERIYKAYFGQVYHYLLSRCGDHHLAEELTADTFFRALRSLDSFRGESDPGTWLQAIARNRLTDHYRTHREAQQLEEAALLADPDAPDPALAAERQEDAMAAYARLHRLEEPYKEVFLLRRWENFPSARSESCSARPKTGPVSPITGPARNCKRRKTHESPLFRDPGSSASVCRRSHR